MGVFDFITNAFGKKTETRTNNSFVDPSFLSALQGTGIKVTKDNAITFTAVFCAIRIIAESVAQLPIKLYKKDKNGNRTLETEHPLYTLLSLKPNNYQTKFIFFEKILFDILTNGNSFVRLVRNGGARVVAMLPMDANNVVVNFKDDQLFYTNKDSGETYDSTDVLHFRGITSDGVMGLSPIDIGRGSISWGLALETYGSTFFGSGAKLSGVLQSDRALSSEAIERLKNSFERNYTSVSNSNKTLILEEGLKFSPISISNEQAQFLASRAFSINEIARLFNLPPYMLKELSKSSFNNIEVQAAEYVRYTLLPYLKNIENELNIKLFKPSEYGKMFTEFSTNALMRGSAKDRSEFYKTMINSGILSVNECRQLENYNNIESGDDHYIPLNMGTLENINLGNND